MYKSRLQELCHQKSWRLPTYTSSKDGPDHDPRFKATVSINGTDFHSPDFAKSSKEAQNEVAKLAFEHFTTPAPLHPASLPSSCSSSSSTGPSGTIVLSSTPCARKALELTSLETFTNSQVRRNGMNFGEDTELREMQYMYKNELQTLTQKRNLSMPVYANIRDGQPHAPRFKATVTVDGQTFESPEFFTTLREAEHAAAKVALASLSDGVQEVDSGFYKNLLQEIAQKEGFSLPIYNTTVSGASHLPTFFSTVEIEGEVFSGKAAKTKKQAEMIAAKVAWSCLKDRRSSRISTMSSQEKESIQPSHLTQSVVVIDSPKSTGPRDKSIPLTSPNIASKDEVKESTGALSRIPANISIGCQTSDDFEGASPVAQQIDHADSLHNLRPRVDSLPTRKTESVDANGGITEKGKQVVSSSVTPRSDKASLSLSSLPKNIDAKALLQSKELFSSTKPQPKSKEPSSSSDVTYSHLRDPFPAETLHLEDGMSSSSSMASESSNLSSTDLKSSTSRRSPGLLGNRIWVYPRRSNMKLPEGAICLPLPISDDGWVAARLVFANEVK